MSETLTIRLNGTPVSLPTGSTLVDALATIGVAPDQPGVAVARGLSVVRRADWSATPLEEGDEVEVVGAAQGG